MQQENYSPCEFIHTQTRNQISNLNYYPKPWTNPHSYFWGPPYGTSQPENWWNPVFNDEPEPDHTELYCGQGLKAEPMNLQQVCYTPNDLVACNTCLKFRQESAGSIFSDATEILAVVGAIIVFIILFLVFI